MKSRRHLFEDLQPYSCTFENCPTSNKTYGSRHEWFDHEAQVHRMQWNCQDCRESFTSKMGFLEHRKRHHPDASVNQQLPVLLEMCSQPADDKMLGKCTLCFNENQPLLKHMAHHMVSLALFALPRRDDDSFELDESDKCEVGVSEEDSAAEDMREVLSESDVMSEISDDPWKEVIDEIDSDLEDPNSNLVNKQPQIQVSDDHQKIMQERADDFWDQAYHVSSKEPRWADYEMILKKELGDSPTEEVSLANNLQRELIMSGLVVKKAEIFEKPEWNSMLDRSYDAHGVVRTVLFTKDCILSRMKRDLHDAMAWAGICLLLPAFLSGVYSEDEADLFDDAGVEEAIPYLAILINRLNFTQRIYYEQHSDSMTSSSDSQLSLRRSFETQMINLCSQILTYQAQAVYQFLEQGIPADESPLPGQISKIKETEIACRNGLGIINQSKLEIAWKESNLRMDELLRLQRLKWEGKGGASREDQQGKHRATARDNEKSLGACLDLLRSIDYESEKDRNQNRAPGTCQWFLEHDSYHNWLDNKSSNVLYLTGSSGCGKSVLMKSLIDGELRSAVSATTCYFFFRDDGSGSESSINALLALIHQLCSQSRAMLRKADEAVRQNQNRISWSFTWLWRLLLSLVHDAETSKVICVLDGLDECEEVGRKRLITSSSELPVDTKSRLMFLLTSRPHFGIDRLMDANSLRLAGDDQIEVMALEVHSMIRSYIPRLSVEKALDLEVQTTLQSCLLKTPYPTQLWLHLTLAAVEEAAGVNGQKGMTRFVKNLPKTLSEAYKALLRLSPQPEQASKLLHIAVAAVRPLTLLEMNMALNLQEGHKSRENVRLQSENNFARYINNLCGSFVTLHHGHVVLTHQTVKEWWSHEKTMVPLQRQLNTPSRENVLSSEPAESHHVLAKTCLIYLASDMLESDLPPIDPAEDGTRTGISPQYEDRRRQILKYAENQSLLEYASLHWAYHFRAVSEHDSEMTRRWQWACRPQSERFHTWFQIYWYGHRMRNDLELNDQVPKLSKIALASFLGHYHMVSHLIERGEALECKAGQGWPPLIAAISSRAITIVSLLIENGASVASETVEDWTPLGFAASKGFMGIVQSLLEHGANVDQKTYRRGITALGKACEVGRTEIVNILLDHGAQIDTRFNDGSTALMVAAKNGRKLIAEILIHHGANIRTSTYLGMTALLYATRSGHEDLAQMLLDHENEVDSEDADGRTILSWAAQQGLTHLVKNMIKRVSLVDSRGDDGLTPLMYATDFGHDIVARVLLNAGADVNATDKQGQTPLFHAVLRGHENLARVLLEAGADKERRDEQGLTALLYAAIHGQTTVIQILLQAGADPKVTDERGQNTIMYALQCLDSRGILGNVSMLLKAGGADVNRTDRQGRTALSYAASGAMGVVRLLLEYGADPNIVDREGWGPLHYAIRANSAESAKILISAGADVKVENEELETPLDLARRLKDQDLLAFMEKHM